MSAGSERPAGTSSLPNEQEVSANAKAQLTSLMAPRDGRQPQRLRSCLAARSPPRRPTLVMASSMIMIVCANPRASVTDIDPDLPNARLREDTIIAHALARTKTIDVRIDPSIIGPEP